jgi:uncharacterized protein YktA (UPF0223 family)
MSAAKFGNLRKFPLMKTNSGEELITLVVNRDEFEEIEKQVDLITGDQDELLMNVGSCFTNVDEAYDKVIEVAICRYRSYQDAFNACRSLIDSDELMVHINFDIESQFRYCLHKMVTEIKESLDKKYRDRVKDLYHAMAG